MTQENWEEKYNRLAMNIAGHYDISLPPEVFDFISTELEKAKQQEQDRIIKIIEEEIFWGEKSESWLVEDKDDLLEQIKK